MIKMIKKKRRNRWVFHPLAMVLACACLAGVSSVSLGAERVPSTSTIQKFTDGELRDLVAPIALYPDALLAQVLPASACPLDIVAAYRYSQTSRSSSTPPRNASWDSSVVSLLHYPTVLKRMYDDLPWTERLGVAVTYQMVDVSDTIQQVRTEARAAGNLVSNDKQVIIRSKNIITIVPADPQIIYVPTYEPDGIFVRHFFRQPLLSFNIGFRSGLWLTNEFDWSRHRISVRNYWHNDRWHPQYGTSYWRPTYRAIPSWYSRGATRTGPTSNYGYHMRNSQKTGREVHTIPSRPSSRPSAPSRYRIEPRSSYAPIDHAEGFNTPDRQSRRESDRGAHSRQSTHPSRYVYEHSSLNSGESRSSESRIEISPSSGQEAHRESIRGSSSRWAK